MTPRASELLCPDGSDRAFPHSGECARCRRERDDLFWHRFDRAFYCADVFRCEQRYFIQGEREARRAA